MINRTVLSLVIISGVLLAFQIEIYGLIAVAILLLFMAGAFSYMLRGKLPKNFWLLLAELIFGPPFISCLVMLLLRQPRSAFDSVLSGTLALIVLLVLMVGSFLYVRSKIVARKNHKEHLHTNERRPILPVHEENESELVSHERN